MTQDTDIAIVGSGLSGLSLAHALQYEGRNVVLLEARDRVGGRVLSQDGYDLGPAWVWPHNRRILSLLRSLGLRTFPQHCEGRLVFEDRNGAIRRDLDFATMGGALRVAGGLAQLTDRLGERLADRILLRHPVLRVIEDDLGCTVTGDGFSLRAGHVVLALPPRLASKLGLSVPDVPTWMAGHAKLVALYPKPFWRDAGLNGDAISHRGPLAEIHDASPDQTGAGALFGFAVPGAARQSDFRNRAIAQLGHLFGSDAAAPTGVFVKDWSADWATATQSDSAPPLEHPRYKQIPSTRRISFAGTETAVSDGGFLEGALAAAEAAHRGLSQVTA